MPMMSNSKKYTVTEAAEKLGLSVDAIRAHCRKGTVEAEYHEFPGTKRGFYLLTDRALSWLQENVSPRASGRTNPDRLTTARQRKEC